MRFILGLQECYGAQEVNVRSLRRAGAAAFKLSSAASVGRMRAVGVGRGDARVGWCWCGPVGAARGAQGGRSGAQRNRCANAQLESFYQPIRWAPLERDQRQARRPQGLPPVVNYNFAASCSLRSTVSYGH